MKYFTLLMRTLFGLALIAGCGYAAFTEFNRSEHRSLLLIAGCAACVIFGALIVPGLDHVVEEKSQTGFRLFTLGRRAYDAKAVVPDIEIPPKVEP